jgi:hypothetical protein
MFFRKKREKEKPDSGERSLGRDLDDPTVVRSGTRPGPSKSASPPVPPPASRRDPDSQEEVGDDVTRFIGAPQAYGSTLVAWLVHTAGPSRGRDLRLGAGTLLVGSGKDCPISLAGDGYVSSRHAELVIERGGVRVRDLQSRNGTFVNGQRIQDAVLADGDRVRFGTTELVFKCVHL